MNIEEYEEQLRKDNRENEINDNDYQVFYRNPRQEVPTIDWTNVDTVGTYELPDPIFVSPQDYDQLDEYFNYECSQGRNHQTSEQIPYTYTEEEVRRTGQYPVGVPRTASQQNRQQFLRQTGRTTRMILGALYELSEGKQIAFVAPTQAILQNIKLTVIHLLQSLNMETFQSNIIYSTLQNVRENRDLNGRNVKVYYDHTCDEER